MDNQEPRPVPPKPAAPPTAGLPHVAVPATAVEPPARKPRRVASTLLKTVFVVVLLGVVGGLVWLAAWLDSGAPETTGDGGSVVVETTPTPLATPLPLPREGVEPPDYRLGDCFKDFDPKALRSTVVACDTGHSAQLVAVFRYPAVGSYPGREALAAKALEACQAAKLAPAANEYTLNFQRAYPSSTSWESGDRRVDCYVTADGGNVINASALP
ncbi:septum formation family protein [Pseudarthrobacter cellobiosi]|uniref:septum formation family protein n=1 Tax=Pseudarthrobacter cellobiosi TaxID=2953654 RepID=UPI00208E18ED|nr:MULTISPECIES: septum formation family protein [unclassified Pseudarthrobacter]MCO4256318.1 septum formation family protein [Pseudarthrobacter sp. HLT1-5]MCO4275658.1 septum formation family protein [Pseudarthrobacter sp. HLT3-5]